MDFNQNLTDDKDLQVLLVIGRPIMNPTNARKKMASILKNKKSTYLCNCLTALTKFGMVMHLQPSPLTGH